MNSSSSPFQPSFLQRAYGYLMRQVRSRFVLAYIMVREFSDTPFSEDADSDFSYAVASKSDLQKALAENKFGITSDFLQQAESRGDVCFAAYHDGEMVSALWNSFNRTPHDKYIGMKVSKPYCYTYKSLTDEKYRGNRLVGNLVRFGDSRLKQIGYTSAHGFIETHNYASKRSMTYIGAKAAGLGGYLRAFGRVFVFRTRGVAEHGFEFYKRNLAEQSG